MRIYFKRDFHSWQAWLVLAMAFAGHAHAATDTDFAVENAAARLQTTYLWQTKPGFPGGSNPPMSLVTQREKRSYTLTATAYLGVRPWDDAELFFNPEMAQGRTLSGLTGLGGLSNGESQKGVGPNPIFYNARLFLRHTWNFGEKTEKQEAELNQLASLVARERMVLTVGKIAVSDIFDDNAFAHDPRTQFINWALMANGAYDYAADSRGYSVGAALEYFRGDWEFRIGRFTLPIESNGLPLDYKIMKHYGDNVEVVHNHEFGGLKGAIRALAYRNHIVTGGFLDAAAASPGSADLSLVRRLQDKKGFGLNMDQMLTTELGVFGRYSKSDGKTETYAFAEIDRSVSFGASLKGRPWGREEDTLGAAFVRNDISGDHQTFMANSGAGVFIGGWPQTRFASERIFEGYYSLALAKSSWLTLDYQHITNPAYNPDRGPVRIFGVRLHAEF